MSTRRQRSVQQQASRFCQWTHPQDGWECSEPSGHRGEHKHEHVHVSLTAPFTADADTPRLNYPGDRRNFDPRHVYGPDAFRAHYRVGAAEYDAEADRTTLYFKPIVPAKTEVAA